MVRFIHTADWQLGLTRHFLPAEAQARFTAARLDAVRTIAGLAGSTGAAFVVVSGDVFESNHVDRQVVVRALEALTTCPVPVYLLPGNHDPFDAASVYRSPTFTGHCPDHVVVLDADAVHEPVPGVTVHGAPWTSKRPLEDLVGGACERLPAGGGLRVLVGHGAVDGLSPDEDNPATIRLAAVEEAISDGRLHFVALGDRHSVTDVGGTGRVWYAGAPEPTDFDEVDPGQVLVVDLVNGDVTVTPHPVAAWRFVRGLFDLNDDADIDAFEQWLGALEDKDRTVVRAGFVGTLTLQGRSRLDGLLDHHADLLAALDVWASATDLAVVPDESDLTALGLAGFAHTAAGELAEAAGHDPTARDALALLHRLAGDAT